ncbi:MAG: DNA adenine methylase [Candidatus Heimdallarchaeota archaeon]
MVNIEENLREIKEGIYLVHPHGEMIWRGDKTLIVKKKKFAWENKFKYLVSGDKCYGIIKIGKIYPISLSDFKKLQNRHRISEIERIRWWPNAQELLAYEFKIVKRFEKPKRVKLPKGIQTAIKKVEFLSEVSEELIHPEEFKIRGVDYDIEHPKERWRELFADLRYLGNSGYPRLVRGEKWGSFTPDKKGKELLLKYFARIVDALRSVYFPICEKKDESSYWKCYQEAKKYMKSKPPSEEEAKEWNKKRKEWLESKKLEEEIFKLGVQQAFGSPGGKSNVAKKLAGFIPEHKTYIEPFAGGAAVYFAKEPSEVEVLNDIDSEIAFAYKFLKNATDEQFARLVKKEWKPVKSRFYKLRDSKPTDPVERYYRFYYLMRHSYGFSMKEFNPKKSPNVEVTLEKLQRIRNRLRNTLIYNEEWKKTMMRFNEKDSFAFLDPPYPKEWPGGNGFSKEDCQDMHDFLKKEWKGKFMLTLNITDWIKEMFSDFNIRRFKIRRSLSQPEAQKPQYEYLITNYPIEEMTETLSEKFAPVGPSENHNLGRPIRWKEVAKNWRKPIMLVKDFIQLVGGVPSHKEGSTGDVDVLIRKNRPHDETEDIPLKFRLYRAQPKEIQKRLHFIYDEYHGPFTNHVPIYHLVLMPVEKQEVHEMSEKPLKDIWDAVKNLDKISKEELLKRHDWIHECYKKGLGPKDDLIDIHSMIWREMRRRAIDHDKISPNDELDKKSRFAIEEYPKIPEKFLSEHDAFTPRFLKPASGYEKFEFADPEKLWDLWKEKYSPLKPIYINPKWDGFSFNLMKAGNKIKLITEDRRRDRASILPQIVAEMKKLPLKSCNITAECVWFREGKALEREEAIRVIVGKDPMPKEDVRMYCYDITFANGRDLTKLPYHERLRILDKIFEKEYKFLKPTPRKLVNDKETFLKWAKKFAEIEGSEGIMAKAIDFKFLTKDSETARTTQMSKWKKSYDIEVEVDRPQPKIDTKTGKPIPGQWIYYVIVRGPKGEPIPIGRTFSTAIKAKKGDILTVRTARLRGFYDPERKKVVKFSMMWPKVLGKRTDKTSPTPFRELMKIAWFPKKIELAESQISLTFLGTKGEVEESSKRHKFHTGLIIGYRGKKLLFDFGENLAGKLEEINPDAIFITHGHPDHCFGLKKGTSKPVYASKETLKVMKDFLLEDIRVLEPGKTVKIFDFEVTPYPVYHSIKCPAFGFLIKVGNRKIVFAPDIIGFKDREKVLKDVDLYIGDGSSPGKDLIRRKDDKIFGHSSMKTQIKVCEKFGIPKVIFTHFGKQFIENEKGWTKELKHVSKEVDVRFASDNDTFQFSELEQELSKKYEYVVQHHWRGASVHSDFRFRQNDHLIGFTLADAEEKIFSDLVGKHWKLEKEAGKLKLYWDNELFYELDKKGNVLKKPSRSLENKVFKFYKGLEKVEQGWKVDWKTGAEKIRSPTKGLIPKRVIKKIPEKIGKVEKIWADFKATQPVSWLHVEGVTPPRAIEAVPGGTYHYPGVFIIVAKGTYEPGVQKPYFKEFFVDKFGRVVFRLVPGMKTKRELDWLYWKPDEQSPYLLSKRALETKTMPPSGISWLPSKIENLIPKEMRYWLPGLSMEERFNRLKQAIEYWKERKMEMNYKLDAIKFLEEIEA